MDNWTKAKQAGSDHYRVGDLQPIDLYRTAGVFIPFALCSIIKYAYRCLVRGVTLSDLEKIRHYSTLIQADKDDTEQVTEQVSPTSTRQKNEYENLTKKTTFTEPLPAYYRGGPNAD